MHLLLSLPLWLGPCSNSLISPKAMGEEERDEEAAVDAKKDRESAAAAASLDKLTDHVRLHAAARLCLHIALRMCVASNATILRQEFFRSVEWHAAAPLACLCQTAVSVDGMRGECCVRMNCKLGERCDVAGVHYMRNKERQCAVVSRRKLLLFHRTRSKRLMSRVRIASLWATA